MTELDNASKCCVSEGDMKSSNLRFLSNLLMKRREMDIAKIQEKMKLQKREE
jgi:hypothetical protein